jgi:large subunit ribosomal protein L29
MSTSELKERLVEERKQLTKLKLNHAVSPLENPLKIKAYRKTVARILTELQQKGNRTKHTKVIFDNGNQNPKKRKNGSCCEQQDG